MRTQCKHGHPWIEENIYTSPKGLKMCRICRNDSAIAAHQRNPKKAREYGRNWMRKQRKENPDRLRNYHFTKNYGLTLEERNAKEIQQEYRCMICRRLMPLEVDHDHDTEQVRDLLCRPCNLAVGLLREDIITAENLVAYLWKWKPCLV
jgi:DNA-directed RNA polymerase subunit RPC12/RpoP